MYKNYLTDVEGILVGHAESEEGQTGCTVILTPQGAVAGVDVRGAAPGTRETDLLRPMNMIERIHGIVLAGGSAFGLDASSGVMQYLEEQGIGFDVGMTKIPIVSSAVLFDLGIGDYRIRPDKEMGYQAAKQARIEECRVGKIGAGKGATVGKLHGMGNISTGGLGSASVILEDGLVVAAVVAVNAFGDIVCPKTGKILAGAKNPLTQEFVNTYESMKKGQIRGSFAGQNTTIGVIATNARCNKEQINKIAQMSHNAYARCISPVHTLYDGDTIFALSYGERQADINLIGSMAVEAMEKAILRAVENGE